MREASSILSEWYTGEVGGEALFSTLGRTANRSEAIKWSALASLEKAMATRLAAALVSRGCPVPHLADPAPGAERRCAAVAVAPWLEKMLWVREIAATALDKMQTDAALLPGDLSAVAALVIAHERALVGFAEAELAGRGDRSLQCVESILDVPT